MSTAVSRSCCVLEEDDDVDVEDDCAVASLFNAVVLDW